MHGKRRDSHYGVCAGRTTRTSRCKPWQGQRFETFGLIADPCQTTN